MHNRDFFHSRKPAGMIRRLLGLGLMVMVWLSVSWGNIPLGQAGEETIHLAGETGTLPDVQIQLISEPVNNPGAEFQTEDLYRGPVTFSIVYGESLDGYNEITPSSSPIKDRLNVERNGFTKAVLWSNAHSVRLFIHLDWPGIEQADARIQELSSLGRLSRIYLVGVAFKMFLEAGDGYFGEIRHYAFDAVYGDWIRGDLPDGTQQIWVQPVRTLDENATAALPIGGKWQIPLFDVTPRRGRILSNDCLALSCLPGEFLTQLDSQVKAEGPIPVMCPGQVAAGISIQKSWIETRPIWWDVSRQLGYKPALDSPGQEWFMISITAEPSSQSFSIVFPNIDGTYQTFPLSQASLYGETSKTVTVDNATYTMRNVQHGIVLEGLIPQGASLQHALLVQTPYGPVWRLSCAGN